MRRPIAAGLTWLATALLVVGPAATPAVGAPDPQASGTPADPAQAVRENLPNPLAEARANLRKEAVAAIVTGKAAPRKRHGSDVVRLKQRYVEYRAAPAVKPVFSVLVEFGTQADPVAGGAAGPLHNQIPEPDRSVDNTTIWRPDFSREYYRQALFGTGRESLRDYFLQQSGGRHKLGGDVSDWVQVPFNQARYGSSKLPPTLAYWPLVRDSARAWYDGQVAAGKTGAQIKVYLSTFDRWDRYDYDGDGNFNEPDGYIDHFQAIHAGAGEETGGGVYGKDAIRSHRWYAFQSDVGSAGPAFNRLGGVPLGDSGLWIGDYTVVPENGGLGVFAQEHARDLDVPDLADTRGGNNGVGPWSLMAGGAWLSRGAHDIGSTPGYLGPWEKLFLGWLNYRAVKPKSGTTYAMLGAAADGSGIRPQAVVVNLPDQQITTEWNSPYSGRYEWWGGSADDLDVTLTRPLDLRSARAATLTAKAQYEIEEDYDFLYAEASTDGGATWKALSTTGVDRGETGLDGSTNGTWVDLTYDLSAYAGRVVQFRFRYQTDGGVHFSGPFLDDIALTHDGVPVWTDTAEAGPGAWVAHRWSRFTGTETRTVPHFYLVENRSYAGYDEALRTGPYHFGWRSTHGDLVERFAAREGMLVWYVNYALDDNNTSEHPGFGMVLPVDARPGPVEVPGYGKVNNATTTFDAAFGKLGSAATTLHLEGNPATVPASPGLTTFDDAEPERYWTDANEENSVKVAGSGTRVEVLVEIHGYVDLMLLKITN